MENHTTPSNYLGVGLEGEYKTPNETGSSHLLALPNPRNSLQREHVDSMKPFGALSSYQLKQLRTKQKSRKRSSAQRVVVDVD